MLITISNSEWSAAKAYFNRYPHETKMKKLDKNTTHSFIRVHDAIYAMANRRYIGEQKFGHLGEGAFGKVKVVQTQRGENFAVKVEGRRLRGEQDAELKIMKILGFSKGEAERSVNKVFKGQYTQKKLYTIMKLIEGEELAKVIYVNGDYNHRKASLSEKQKLCIALEACNAIKRLHDKGIVHADIKPANLMSKIDGSDTILIEAIDFGLSHKLPFGQDTITTYHGGCTPFYMAPEINQGIYSFSSDVYALGIMFTHDLQLTDPKFKAMLNRLPHARPSLSEMIIYLENNIKKKHSPNSTINLINIPPYSKNQVLIPQSIQIPMFDREEFRRLAQQRKQALAEKVAAAQAQKEEALRKKEARWEEDRHAIKDLQERILQAQFEATKRKIKERIRLKKKNLAQNEENILALVEINNQAKRLLNEAEEKIKPFFSHHAQVNPADYSYITDECNARLHHIKIRISLLKTEIIQYSDYVEYHKEFPHIFKNPPSPEQVKKLELELQQAHVEKNLAEQHVLLFSYFYTKKEYQYKSSVKNIPQEIAANTVAYLFNVVKLNLYQRIRQPNAVENHAALLEKNVKKIVSTFLIDIAAFNTNSNNLMQTSEFFIQELQKSIAEKIQHLANEAYPKEVKNQIQFLLNQELEKCALAHKLSDFEIEIRQIVTKYKTASIPLEIIDSLTLETDFNKIKAYYEQNFPKPIYILGEYWDEYSYRNSPLKTELISAMKKIPYAFFNKNQINLNNLNIILSTPNIASFSQADFEQAIIVLQEANALFNLNLSEPFNTQHNLFSRAWDAQLYINNAAIKIQAAYIEKIIHTNLKNLSHENLNTLKITVEKLMLFNSGPLINSQLAFLGNQLKIGMSLGMEIEESTVIKPTLFSTKQQKELMKKIIPEKNKKNLPPTIKRGIRKR